MNKEALRKAGLAIRRNLPPEIRVRKSAEIRTRLFALDCVQTADTILSYVASKDNEVDTLPIIRQLLDRQTKVLVPMMQPGETLLWSRLTAIEELVPARFGILEPGPDFQRITPVPNNALCLVPGIVFSANGYRIGYGGGYFDRFLSSFSGKSIGLAFECQIQAPWIPEPHDRSVSIVLTEENLYQTPSESTKSDA